ncbi:p53 and DNA damage-regulated protein 1-like [Haliotis cracherodii]|uniref:p53 and DNA damage-regulated protein 1-like n=1 Tax=Haliotis rufescens TaxID=6454 RepID=UPI001EAFFFBD|nr:p53 and DNA damage-regulated protein 1-like [Haliotis rufescens]XP_048248077.1 p53 and DNA damage-regulated protein 1-like [Haliotis rufescens]
MSVPDTSDLLSQVALVEEAAEDILADRRQIIDLDKKRNKTREAIRALQKNKESDKSWVCFGNMFIKLPNKKAVNLLEKDYNQLDEELTDIRNKLKPKVNNLRNLENKEDMKGFGLNPLSKEELRAVEKML